MVLDDNRTGATASVYNHGYAASREQAMRYFKARYVGPRSASTSTPIRPQRHIATP